jgi:hypothetical protein
MNYCVFGMVIDRECNCVSYKGNCLEVYENKVARLSTFDATSNIFKVHATRSVWKQDLGLNSDNNNGCVVQETCRA